MARRSIKGKIQVKTVDFLGNDNNKNLVYHKKISGNPSPESTDRNRNDTRLFVATILMWRRVDMT